MSSDAGRYRQYLAGDIARFERRLEEPATIERGVRVAAAEYLENRPLSAARTVAHRAVRAQGRAIRQGDELPARRLSRELGGSRCGRSR